MWLDCEIGAQTRGSMRLVGLGGLPHLFKATRGALERGLAGRESGGGLCNASAPITA